ncbi:hypothetical protein QUF75_15385 [Desulfococcaceae bacterium HSG7]|nr:hypothetical protein [Desulfococcaceae bacterium HSG7]
MPTKVCADMNIADGILHPPYQAIHEPHHYQANGTMALFDLGAV